VNLAQDKIKVMPKPKPNEKKKDFMNRCIPELVREGKKQNQAIAQCSSVYENRNKYSTDSAQNG
jgi:hypothetical protein